MSRRRGIVIQQRDKHLLRELAVMKIIDREQAKRVAGFGSTTRANTRLLALCRAGALRRFFLGTTAGQSRALYSLADRGAELVDVPYRNLRRSSDESLVADFFVRHQLFINQIYLAVKYGPLPEGVTFQRWLAFHEPIVPGLQLIPDGYLELRCASGDIAAFLEVDLGHESLAVWRKKVEKYMDLTASSEYKKRFTQEHLRILVLAPSDRRLNSIRRTIATVTDKVFWFANLESLQLEGFFACVWLRPCASSRQPFIGERS